MMIIVILLLLSCLTFLKTCCKLTYPAVHCCWPLLGPVDRPGCHDEHETATGVSTLVIWSHSFVPQPRWRACSVLPLSLRTGCFIRQKLLAWRSSRRQMRYPSHLTCLPTSHTLLTQLQITHELLVQLHVCDLTAYYKNTYQLSATIYLWTTLYDELARPYFRYGFRMTKPSGDNVL